MSEMEYRFTPRQTGNWFAKRWLATIGMIQQWLKEPTSKIMIAAPTRNFIDLKAYKQLAKDMGFDMTFTEPKKVKGSMYTVEVNIRRAK